MNSFQDLVFILDEKGVFIDYLGNEASPDLLVKKEDFMGKYYAQVLPSYISNEVDKVYSNLAESSYRFEYMLSFPEGERWFSAILSRFIIEGTTKMALVVRNVTQAKKQEILNQSILDSSMSGILAFKAARNNEGIIEDFIITQINKAGEKTIGYTAQECLGKGLLQLSTNKQIKSIFNQYVNTVETGEVLDFETSSILNNKEAWIHIVASKMGDGLVVSFEDITKRKQSEERLRETESTNKLLTENMLDMVALHESDGTYSYISPSVEKILGYKPDELIGKNPYDIFHPDDRNRIREASHNPILEGEESVSDIQYRMRTKSGQYIWFETSTKAILDDNGKLAKLQTISRNITRRKSLQLELTEAYNNFQTIFNASTIVGFIATDLNGTIKNFNAGAEQILGYKSEEVVNKHTPMLFHVPEEVAAHAEKVSKELGRPIQGFETFTARAKQGYFEESEWTFIHKGGHFIDVNLAITAIKNVSGDITGYLGVAYDITQRKRTEHTIKASESKYRTIFQNIRDVFFRTDINGIVTEISPSVSLHSDYLPEDIIGKPVDEFYYYLEDRHKLRETLQADQEINDFEVRLKNKNGRLVYISVNAHLNFDENGKNTGYEGIMRDISERKKAEESILKLNKELGDLNRQKTKLFSIISHDLRGPIANTISLMDIIQTEFDSFEKEEMKMYLDLLKKSASNAFELLEDLLLWTRNQFDKIIFAPTSLKLAEHLERVLYSLGSAIESKKIDIKTDISTDLTLTADQDMLRTILRNLVSNAIKFSKEGSEIEVSAEKGKQEVTISIKDYGVGIKEENLNEIFNKSSSFTTFGTKGEKGSGLGLDLCVDFVEKHQGKIWVESVYGKGTTFKFTLPQPDL